MKLDRLVPVAAAILLVASLFGASALADQDGSDWNYCSEQYPDDPEKREQCEEAYRQQQEDSSDSYERDYESPEERDENRSERYEDSETRRSDAPRPMMELPAEIAPDVDERREFFQNQSEKHREFHQAQQEERRSLIENQSQERDAFVADLLEDCLNLTSSEAEAAANASNEEIRDRLEEADGNETTECLRDLRAFLMEQQEEREDLLERQRGEHQAFHEELQVERETFLEEQREKDQRRAEEAHEEWTQRQVPEDEGRPMGAFQADDGSVDGKYVSFNYTADPAALADVRVKGIPLFEAAVLDSTAQTQVRGVSFGLLADEGAIVIHDNPAVAFQIQTDDAGWTLDLAQHLTVNATGDDERWTLTDGEALHGHLLFEDDPTYDAANKSFSGDDGVRFVVVPQEAVSGPSPAEDPDAADEDVETAVRDAMAKGTLGAEVNLASENGDVSEQTIVYDNLNVSLTETEKDKVRFVVDGELETGRTIVLNAPSDLFESDRLNITYEDVYDDGTTEDVPIRLADGVRDVMNPNDDSTPEYLPTRGADGWQVMVSVPHFSAHAVTIQSVTAQAPPSVVAGVVAAIGFLGFAGVNLFRRSGA